MFWTPIEHRSYVHRSCVHRSHVQSIVLHWIEDGVLHCRQCPTLNTVSYIVDSVLKKPYNYLWFASSPANTSWRGSHSLPKPLSDIFETFWISASQYVRNVQNSTKMPYKDLTRYKIFLAVSKYILRDGGFCPKTRFASLHLGFYTKQACQRRNNKAEVWLLDKKWVSSPWNDSMFKYWLW